MFASYHADNCSGGQRKYPGSLNLDKRAISRGRIATGWQKEGVRKGYKVKISIMFKQNGVLKLLHKIGRHKPPWSSLLVPLCWCGEIQRGYLFTYSLQVLSN